MLQSFDAVNGWRDTTVVHPDRGLQFGDGLFETVRLNAAGQAPLLQWHRQRLLLGLERLNFSSQAQISVLQAFDAGFSGPGRSDVSAPETNGLKLIVTRGVSARGYLADPELTPVIYRQRFVAAPLSDSSSGITVGVNPVRLGIQPLLAGVKHLNRLEQVLARQCFKPDWQESLMLDAKDQVVEGCMSNVYLCLDDQWLTPALYDNGVEGVIRSWLLDRGYVREATITTAELGRVSAMAFSNTLTGLQSVTDFEGRALTADGRISVWQSELLTLFA